MTSLDPPKTRGLKLTNVLTDVKGEWQGPFVGDLTFPGVSVDSRTIKPGELFVAIKGPNFDGNDFVIPALKAGAGAVIAERGDLALKPAILVKDGLKALGDLALGVRRRASFKVLAITGSLGKTTVKEMVKNILAAPGGPAPYREILATQGNLNNEVGLPLTILSIVNNPLPPLEAVLEMGAAAPGDISYLTKIALPDVGLITALGPAHLEFFGDIKTIAKTKAELIHGLAPGAIAVVNKGDPLIVAELKEKAARAFYYGQKGEVWLKARKDLGIEGQKIIFGGPALANLEVKLKLLGEGNALNAVAAAAGALAFGRGRAEIKAGLSQMEPVTGRLKPTKSRWGYVVLDDSYNASPNSVKAALKVLASLPGPGVKGAILGDMLELGPQGKEYHREVGHIVASMGLDFLGVVGKFSRYMESGARAAIKPRFALRVFPNPEEAAAWAKGLMGDKGYVLVKGSRAVGLERAVAKLLS
ncbi:MAG: UDP-N-acetylmuramoyl-tripeptide--D-alanyl-D-alanine ligase [Deltaproteobacteria bacterium]|jgi:UDP-N-acetylmuramoyl-tripeptide--D-alanyl-D-alanine ligase|nr:UDP-N-acetylmuramoyl-tripeptide--D-alanyl-D-alanine ligase [Deltaproteobacteria bacterium]